MSCGIKEDIFAWWQICRLVQHYDNLPPLCLLYVASLQHYESTRQQAFFGYSLFAVLSKSCFIRERGGAGPEIETEWYFCHLFTESKLPPDPSYNCEKKQFLVNAEVSYLCCFNSILLDGFSFVRIGM